MMCENCKFHQKCENGTIYDNGEYERECEPYSEGEQDTIYKIRSLIENNINLFESGFDAKEIINKIKNLV